MQIPKYTVSFHADQALYDWLCSEAKRSNMSVSALLRALIIAKKAEDEAKK